jgi:hypothetical protein
MMHEPPVSFSWGNSIYKAGNKGCANEITYKKIMYFCCFSTDGDNSAAGWQRALEAVLHYLYDKRMPLNLFYVNDIASTVSKGLSNDVRKTDLSYVPCSVGSLLRVKSHAHCLCSLKRSMHVREITAPQVTYNTAAQSLCGDDMQINLSAAFSS